MKIRERNFSGTTNPQVTKRELANRETARRAAAEGIVLMKNEGLLPLAKGSRVALFGGGAAHTIKGGTGSGDVNEREVVSIYQGMENAGFEITSKAWLADYEQTYQKVREDWKQMILKEMRKQGMAAFFDIYSSHAFEVPTGRALEASDFGGADTAVYVISRVAGEGADRHKKAGDYDLTETEKADLRAIGGHCENVIVVINAGAQIDLKDILALPQVKALIYLCQPGMEGGNALGDVLTGAVNPSGKLTDTWAKDYSDFPNAETFSHSNGDVTTEKYEEGLYVGYRYFESFEVEPEYPFGFGLSYTDFSMETKEITADAAGVRVTVEVKNTGAVYAGKEVVQVYAACPQEELPKEYRRLCGFAKTKELQPGESQLVEIAVPSKRLAAFDEERGCWIAERGQYGIFVGNSSKDARLAGCLEIEQTVVLETVEHICPLQEELTELLRPEDVSRRQESAWKAEAKEKNLPKVTYAPAPIEEKRWQEDEFDRMAAELVEKLSDEELTAMVIGEVSRGHDNALGAAGIMVPGAAGETSGILEKTWNVPPVSMADGPAGLRLLSDYEADVKQGIVYGKGICGAMEHGLFYEAETHEGAQTFYQYCTAIPVGALLAQTWNEELLEEVGRAIAAEMQEFCVSWWLAPGMNIHRNPLCGRNFEYFSEDPLVSGKMAAAITRGVQSLEGVGTTIKHFACNNQEDNRMGSNSVVSERTLRELYLTGFEIAVKESQPMAIMTSYNSINGVHTANSRDLCTVVARGEWDFRGIIMTDWTTTTPKGGSTPWKCPAVGNDLIMPGWDGDRESILAALADGSLDREALKACVRRMVSVIYQTLGYEDCQSYGKKYSVK